MTIIKNGTIVTADLTYKADIRIDGETITEIGQNLSGGDVLDATGCYVMVWAEVAVAAVAGSASYGLIALLERAITFWHPSVRGGRA